MNYRLLIKEFKYNGEEKYPVRNIKIKSDLFTTEMIFILEKDTKKDILELLKTQNVMCLDVREGLEIRATFLDLSNIAKASKILKEHGYIDADFADKICKNYPIGRPYRLIPKNKISLFSDINENTDPLNEKIDDITKTDARYGFYSESTYRRPNLNNIPSQDMIASVYNLEILSIKANDDESLTVEFQEKPDTLWSQIEKVHAQLKLNTYALSNNSGHPWIKIYPCDVDKFSQNLEQLYKENFQNKPPI